MNNVTIADQLPPLEMTSVTSRYTDERMYQTSSGKRNVRRAAEAAAITRSSSSQRVQFQPANALLDPAFESQPHHVNRIPRNDAHIATAPNAKTPAPIHAPRRRRISATASNTVSGRSAQAVNAPFPYCVARYASEALAEMSTVSPPT